MNLGEGLRLVRLSVGPMDNNAYLLVSNGRGLLIDAAAEPSALIDLIGEVTLESVVTTHRHADHHQALAAVVGATGATAYAGRPDAAAITDATGVTCVEVWDGDHLRLGDAVLTVIGLVGHTPGSICLAYRPVSGPGHLFTGDSLFPGGVGKTSAAGDFTSLLTDVTVKLFDRFADDTVVHPGHGRSTTLGAERPSLPHWRARGW